MKSGWFILLDYFKLQDDFYHRPCGRRPMCLPRHITGSACILINLIILNVFTKSIRLGNFVSLFHEDSNHPYGRKNNPTLAMILCCLQASFYPAFPQHHSAFMYFPEGNYRETCHVKALLPPLYWQLQQQWESYTCVSLCGKHPVNSVRQQLRMYISYI